MDELERARLNREMVAGKRNIEGYQEVEAALKKVPFNKQLPDWIPVGNIPKVHRKDVRNGFHEIREDE